MWIKCCKAYTHHSGYLIAKVSEVEIIPMKTASSKSQGDYALMNFIGISIGGGSERQVICSIQCKSRAIMKSIENRIVNTIKDSTILDLTSIDVRSIKIEDVRDKIDHKSHLRSGSEEENTKA